MSLLSAEAHGHDPPAFLASWWLPRGVGSQDVLPGNGFTWCRTALQYHTSLDPYSPPDLHTLHSIQQIFPHFVYVLKGEETLFVALD